jgi:O-antigen/teichoic acid export membrane protein
MKRLLRPLATRFRTEFDAESLRGSLSRAATVTVLIKIGALLIAIVSSVLLARVLQPGGFGMFAFTVACVSLLTVPASLGMPQYLVKHGALNPGSAMSLRRWADLRVALAGTSAFALFVVASMLTNNERLATMLLIASPLPLIGALTSVRQALLQCRGLVPESQWPQQLLAPALLVLFLAGLWLFVGDFSPLQAIGVTLAVSIVPLVVNSRQLFTATGQALQDTLPSLRAALPFMWLGALYLLISRTDLVMLGVLRGAEDAGRYAVASRIAEVLPFISYAASSVASPHFAKLHRAGDMEKLQGLLTGMGRRVLLATVPLTAAVVLFAVPLLDIVFGRDYAQAAPLLRVLAAAQLVVVMGGPLGTLLNMSGYESTHLRILGIAAVTNVLFNFALIPTFGAVGAATATLVSVVVSRGAVRSRLGLRSTLVGI